MSLLPFRFEGDLRSIGLERLIPKVQASGTLTDISPRTFRHSCAVSRFPRRNTKAEECVFSGLPLVRNIRQPYPV